MSTITIMDPVTRIEGHMKVEITVDTVGGQQQIADARCTGTLFRGFESILQGHEPMDAPVITQRICGVCPVSHAMASVHAIEDAVGQPSTGNARLLRNLTLAANFVQSHLLHFYVLALFDYVNGPDKSPWQPAWNSDVRNDPRLAKMINHFGLALIARRKAHEMGAVFGGKMPSPHTYIPGGFTSTPTNSRINQFRSHLQWLAKFVRFVYIPDVWTVADVYKDYFKIGEGSRNLLAYGVFNQNDQGGDKLFKRGFAFSGSKSIDPVNVDFINEEVSHSWYADSSSGLNPADGATDPVYPKEGAYSWLKSPRYNGAAAEVGPLARMWVNGDYQTGISVMDRHIARAYETFKIVIAMNRWLDELQVDRPVYNNINLNSGTGVGLTEAPRGALGHWVEINQGRINHYQIITPTCWNASPMDDANVPGPMEQALIGTPIADPDQPIEALRVIHSFDPCLSCAVHLLRPAKKPTVIHTGGCAC